MKKSIFEVVSERKNGDSFSKWFFNEDVADSFAKSELDYLTESERKASELRIIEYKVEVPEDYSETAEQFVTDLSNGDVESVEYDECLGSFSDSCQVNVKVI